MNTLFQLATLFDVVTEIEGRKKLQKAVHILQEFGVSFGVSFGYHHYGPFSEQLQDCLQSAQHDDLIQETEVIGQPPTSKFKAGERLIQLQQLLGVVSPPPWADLAKELIEKTPRELETLSTLIYLEKLRGGSSKPEEIESEFRTLKPHLADRLEAAKSTLVIMKKKYPPESLQGRKVA